VNFFGLDTVGEEVEARMFDAEELEYFHCFGMENEFATFESDDSGFGDGFASNDFFYFAEREMLFWCFCPDVAVFAFCAATVGGIEHDGR